MSKTHHTGEQYKQSERPTGRRFAPSPARLSLRDTDDIDALIDAREMLADDWRDMMTDAEVWP